MNPLVGLGVREMVTARLFLLKSEKIAVGMEVQLYSSLTSTLDGEEWPALCPVSSLSDKEP